MFKKLFGSGGGGEGAAAPGSAAAVAAADPAASSLAAAAASDPPHHPRTIPEDADGPVDYAPPPLGVHAPALGEGSAASLGKHFDAAEAGAAGSATRPSFVWEGASGGDGGSAAGGGRSASWLGGGADLGARGYDDAAVMRVPSVGLARRMSRRSGMLSADFERRRSSANFAKLGSDHEGHSNWATAACHLVTAMIGAGILGLPNSFAWLGWIGGPVCLVFFLAVTVYCLFHLIECYQVRASERRERKKKTRAAALPRARPPLLLTRLSGAPSPSVKHAPMLTDIFDTPHFGPLSLPQQKNKTRAAAAPQIGHVRSPKYADLIYHVCGRKHAIVLALSQRLNMILTCCGYSIAGAHSITFLAKAAYTLQGKPPSTFASSQRVHTIMFGALQLVMSQLPNLESAWWSSAIGAGE